ncbi:MAG TPA: tetratricopeptide repeat protein [Symbiobacteriaceae bacterium]|jgi:tetratricopeptide (TPR) repeat protein
MKRIALFVLLCVLLAACNRSGKVVAPDKAVSPEPPPYQPTEQHKQALALSEKADYTGAEVLLKQVVVEQPGAAEAWNDLSFMQSRLSKWTDAVKSAQKALELNPRFAYAEYNLGWALLHTVNWKDAKAPLATSADLQPDRPEPLFALGEWYRMAGDNSQAAVMYGKAAAMGDQRAQAQWALLPAGDARTQEVEAAVAAYPNVPATVIRDIYSVYTPPGSSRRLDQMLPMKPKAGGYPAWAALISETGKTYQSVYVQVQSDRRDAPAYATYLGKCYVSDTDSGKGSVGMQVLPYPEGDHVLVMLPNGAQICGNRKGSATETLETLFKTAMLINAGPAGIKVGIEPYRFVPEVFKYLPVAQIGNLTAVTAEVRKVGYHIAPGSAVWAQVDLGGGAGTALAWTEGVAFKPDGKPAVLYSFQQETTDKVRYASPVEVSTVAVKGHIFLVLRTLERTSQNGADVLVLEYDKTGGAFRRVFHVMADSTKIDKDRVLATVKHYLPQGGFELYVTDYIWDEAAHTFVKNQTTVSGNK